DPAAGRYTCPRGPERPRAPEVRTEHDDVSIALRYAARSDVGLVRANNQDSGFAGPHLLVVAAGMGGHAGGDVASSVAIAAMAPLDDEAHGPDDALAALDTDPADEAHQLR